MWKRFLLALVTARVRLTQRVCTEIGWRLRSTISALSYQCHLPACFLILRASVLHGAAFRALSLLQLLGGANAALPRYMYALLCAAVWVSFILSASPLFFFIPSVIDKTDSPCPSMLMLTLSFMYGIVLLTILILSVCDNRHTLAHSCTLTHTHARSCTPRAHYAHSSRQTQARFFFALPCSLVFFFCSFVFRILVCVCVWRIDRSTLIYVCAAVECAHPRQQGVFLMSLWWISEASLIVNLRLKSKIIVKKIVSYRRSHRRDRFWTDEIHRPKIDLGRFQKIVFENYRRIDPSRPIFCRFQSGSISIKNRIKIALDR